MVPLLKELPNLYKDNSKLSDLLKRFFTLKTLDGKSLADCIKDPDYDLVVRGNEKTFDFSEPVTKNSSQQEVKENQYVKD
eukprot:CAMPEP_0116886592 /NCGR_PEP_ID=MMETSP0463-20121206/20516_1 /TAXON_ID=181622 /ORGANISM="Strombidinopsis sp, Strain SopsisLIS2011" /LENGTH=79 /DNA_ID=CAMNT_0004547315 /DNA_START=47 /DNA_END=286 /DNA_ORIENTATION=+